MFFKPSLQIENLITFNYGSGRRQNVKQHLLTTATKTVSSNRSACKRLSTPAD